MTFPINSKLPKPQVLYKPHKKGNSDFFDNLALSQKEKQQLRKDIQLLQVTHQLNETNLNIPAGKLVQHLFVIEVVLTGESFDSQLLEQLDSRLAIYAIYQLSYPDGHQSYLVNYKEPLTQEKDGKKFKIIRTFQNDHLELVLTGLTLDNFYDQLVKRVASDKLADTSSNVGQAIALTEQIKKLEKEAERLKKKMFAAKSMRQQMDYKKARQQVLADLEQLKQTK
ncbi:DUF4391 domain-containing protein [Streptococcus equi]|uniref:DUF4391 domain-containing protein n=1 Tax=Streptococcus equi subsp. ruminatorum TaxID=254358 RepID=A0A6M1KMR7_9STRE|nr:DUF4391 domain-containing protein [Streptococcus equi]NGL83233.1 DUF4391 domain-containing protein [Streptococcus equi subsp. ruminatorum]